MTPSLPRIACLGHSSIAGAGVCCLLASWGTFAVVHGDDAADGSVMALLVIGDDRAADLARARGTARETRLLAVGPADLTALAVRAGASGYATLDCAESELRQIVLAVLAGRRGLSQDATEALIDAGTVRPSTLEDLTPRQLDLLRRVAAGQSHTAIARDLGISRQAVGQALERLRQRAGVATSRELVGVARDRALVPPAN